MTQNEWTKREDLVEAWAQVLASPVMVAVLSVMVDKNLPCESSDTKNDTPNLLLFNALANAKQEGYFDFYRKLQQLAIPPRKALDAGSFESWGHDTSEGTPIY